MKKSQPSAGCQGILKRLSVSPQCIGNSVRPPSEKCFCLPPIFVPPPSDILANLFTGFSHKRTIEGNMAILISHNSLESSRTKPFTHFTHPG
jgi:hypothetical protein